jgi:hypothetical protein
VARLRHSAAKVDRPLRGRCQRTQLGWRSSLRAASPLCFFASPDGPAALPCARASGIPRANTYSTRRRNRRLELCSWTADHRQKIARARRAARTPSNGLETANQKGTSQPAWWAVRVRSLYSLFVVAWTELNQLQRQAPSSAIEELRGLSIACKAFMTPINKRPKCLRHDGGWN